MSRHPNTVERAGIGHVQYLILVAISQGTRDPRGIRARITENAGDAGVEASLQVLQQRGYVRRARGGGYYLEAKAHEHLPDPSALIAATGHYVRPTAPPRRPGSDHGHLPSVAGGRLYYRTCGPA